MWTENFQMYKMDLEKADDPDNHNGVIIYLEPDILLCKVNWALMNRVVEGIEFQLSYLKS